MNIGLLEVALIGIVYLCVLFGIALSAEKNWIPSAVTDHPLTRVFALGIFASAWAYYGAVDLAFEFGYGALAYYLGTGALFFFGPVAIAPLAQLTQRFQINSLADLLVFRFHSQAAGTLATLCMLLAALPLLALQIQAVTDTLQILTASSPREELPEALSSWGIRDIIAVSYCLALAVFTILFGSSRDRHKGLLVAMAFESLLKIVALCGIGLFAVYGVFGGMAELDQWLLNHPENLDALHQPLKDNAYHSLLLIFIASAVAMPHIFQMHVIDHPMKMTKTLTWAFPLLLLFMALPIFPILWAGFELGVPIDPQYFTLAIPMQSGSYFLTILAFIGGLSAATGAMVVIVLALSTVILNHWVLPITSLKHNLYQQLLWHKRTLIAIIFAASFVFFRFLSSDISLIDLALLSFIETLQFLPGVFAVIYWPSANSRGFIAGLFVGTTVWLLGLLLPILMSTSTFSIAAIGLEIPVGAAEWNAISAISLSLNIITFMGFSWLTHTREEERYSADLCAEDELSYPLLRILDVHSADDFVDRLGQRLGHKSATKEVRRALQQLNFSASERRPFALRKLREQLDANLSGLMGTAVAGEVLDRHIPYHLPEAKGTTDINLIESRLTQYRSHLSGLAAELNNLRLYHRNTLEDLPMAVCSVGQDWEVLMWNHAMEKLTGIETDEVIGSNLEDLPQPWQDLLNGFSLSDAPHLHKQKLELQGSTHWISLHKANISGPVAQAADGQVILLEDMTETQLLEQELMHSERLASVGRLAAGVAHEIGNPVTGIACLAQNLKYETDNPDSLEAAGQILDQTERITSIVQSLVNFSHSGQHQSEGFIQVSAADCAAEAIHLLSIQHHQTEIVFDNQIDPELTLMGNPQRLTQVFINLLSNARDASPSGSRVLLASRQDATHNIVDIIDEGEGIPLIHQERVIEPFFTSKEPGEGTGLGLAMVYSIVEEHHGILEITSPVANKDCGTQITIKIPTLALESPAGNTID